MVSQTYVGSWVDWTTGPVLGRTLTMTASNGALMVAFLALFVRLAGSHLWNIICFSIHQRNATRELRCGLQHQHQAILRNTTTDSDTLWNLVKVNWAWRSKSTTSFARRWTPAGVALLHIITLSIAGLFSSRATIATEDVLVRSPACGDWGRPVEDFTNKSSIIPFQDWRINNRRGVMSSFQYAQACYGTSIKLAGCDIYSKRAINFTVNRNSPCLFAPGTCIADTAIQLDTLHLDSHNDLGINAPKKYRVTYRRVLTCAVIPTDSFVQLEDGGSDDIPGEKITRYYFGQVPGADYNWTYSYSSYANGLASQAYNLELVSGFTPVEAIRVSNASVVLAFLSSSARYTDQVDDPWFSAHTPTTFANGEVLGDAQVYQFDQVASVLGCAIQHQFCNPNLPDSLCSPLTTNSKLRNWMTDATIFNARQNYTLQRISDAIVTTSMSETIDMMGSSVLLAQNALNAFTSAPLDSQQWMLEVQNWFSIMMAHLQRTIVDFASGPSNPDFRKYVKKPTEPNLLEMCYNQKFRDANYTSFSVLPVAIILCIGSVIILLNLVLDTVAGLIQQRTRHGELKRVEWRTDSMLHLQRLAYENKGIGTWTNIEDDIPTTARGEKFGLPFGSTSVIRKSVSAAAGGSEYELIRDSRQT